MRIIWTVCFGWWVVPLLDWQTRRNLIARTRESFWFLFQERGGHFIDHPRGSGEAYRREVVILAQGLIFYVWQIANPDESGVGVQVAPSQVPGDTHDLSVTLMLLDPSLPVQRRLWISLPFIAAHLRSHFDSLKDAFSLEQFEATKQQIRLLEVHGATPPQ